MSTRLLAAALAAAASAAGALPATGIPVENALAGSSGGISTEDRRSEKTTSGDRYTRIWERMNRRNRRWARKTAECESGRDPDAIGGGGRYRGAFQFLRSTWKAAPKSPGGDPIKYSYRTQAVVAVALKKRDGAGHWPNCG